MVENLSVKLEIPEVKNIKFRGQDVPVFLGFNKEKCIGWARVKPRETIDIKNISQGDIGAEITIVPRYAGILTATDRSLMVGYYVENNEATITDLSIPIN
jgi:hypothetical protein